MSFRKSVSRILLGFCLFLLVPTLLYANNATVDCSGATAGAFTKIQDALNSFPKMGPNTINVLPSSCTEHVQIREFTDLSIFASPGTVTVTGSVATTRVLGIADSVNVFVDGINFIGGRGIVISNSSEVFLGDGGMQKSTGLGLTSLNSNADIFNFNIQNSVRSGISATGGNFSLDGGVNVSNNGRFGISMVTGHLTLNGGDGTAANPNNIINNNGFFGVSAGNNAEVDAFAGNEVSDNGFIGVQVFNSSTLEWSGGGTIAGNKGVGIHVAGTSHADIDTVTISGNGASVTSSGGLTSTFGAAGGIEIVENSDGFLNGGVNVSNNHSIGVFTDESSVLSSLGGNTVNNNAGNGFLLTTLSVAHFFGADTVTHNTGEALECDNTSVVIGKVPSHEKCANVKLK